MVLVSTDHPAPTLALNPARTGYSRVALPRSLDVLWRSHVPFGISRFAVASAGRLLVASPSAQLTELDRDGNVVWTHELSAEATSSVDVLRSGTRVVATARGLLEGFDDHGRRVFAVEPGWSRPDDVTHLLSLADASFVAANLRRLSWFEADGGLRAEVELDETIQELAFVQGSVVALLRSGALSTWDGRSEPRPIGDFGSDLRSLPIVREGKLLALTRTGLREKDPRTGQVRSWFGLEVTDSVLLTVTRDGAAWLDEDNGLNRVTAGGQHEKEPLGPQPTGTPAGVQPLSDAQGNLALLNALGEVTLIDSTRRVTSDGQVRCAAPVALLPQMPGRLVLACASGSIWAMGS